jgi:hypothetical protein
MRSFRTVVVGIVAFGLGAVASGMMPTAAALQPQKPFVTATVDEKGVTFRNVSDDSRVLVVGVSDTGKQPPGPFTRDTLEVRMPADGSPVYLLYELRARALFRKGQLELCTPTSDCPDPPRCPQGVNCPPWLPGPVVELRRIDGPR